MEVNIQYVTAGASGKLVANRMFNRNSNGNVYSIAQFVSENGLTLDLTQANVTLDILARCDSSSTSRSITTNVFPSLVSS